jgi:hypothetical protein
MAGGNCKPLNYDELERWTRVVYEQGLFEGCEIAGGRHPG